MDWFDFGNRLATPPSCPAPFPRSFQKKEINEESLLNTVDFGMFRVKYKYEREI